MVKLTMERHHECKAMESIDTLYIQTLNGMKGWFWCFVEHKNTLKERVHCHEIQYCPYCGEKLCLGG